MELDWKDALARLKDSNELPDGSAEDNAGPDPEPQPAPGVQNDALNVVMERKGRGGKTATIIEGFVCDDDEVARVAAILKQKLGTGGSSRGGEILIQGDRRQQVGKLLRELGYKVKGC